jgi:ABC-2 type transport system ATP-binding protein
MNTPAIQITDLTKRYGKDRGIEKITLQVEEGEIFGFIGPNGAGKFNHHPGIAEPPVSFIRKRTDNGSRHSKGFQKDKGTDRLHPLGEPTLILI